MQTLKLKSSWLMTFLMDKWNIVGLGGMLLTGFSIPNLGFEGGLLTGLAGISMTVITVWQKYRQEKRNEEKHNIQMSLVQKIIDGKMEMDKEVVMKFLE